MCTERLLAFGGAAAQVSDVSPITIFPQFLSVCFLNLGSFHGSAATLQCGKSGHSFFLLLPSFFYPPPPLRFLRHGAIVTLRGRRYSLQSGIALPPATAQASPVNGDRNSRKKVLFTHIRCSCSHTRDDLNETVSKRVHVCTSASGACELCSRACFHCKGALSILVGKL